MSEEKMVQLPSGELITLKECLRRLWVEINDRRRAIKLNEEGIAEAEASISWLLSDF